MTQLDQVLETHDDPAARGDGHPARLGRKRDHSRDPEILEAALDVLAEHGYEGMTVEMVATRARAGKATLYRRWPSKAELVIDAVACLKQAQFSVDDLPDTGTLRGDLVALIRPHSLAENDRKLQVIGGLVSMLARDPQLADAMNEAITEPRARLNRLLIQRAIERGEVSAEADVATIATIGPSMTAYRTLVLRLPVDREFLVGLIDGVVLPALGLPPGDPG